MRSATGWWAKALSVGVVVGGEQLPAGQRRSVDAAAHRQAQIAQHLPRFRAGDAGVVGEAQLLRALVEEVDHRAVRAQQSRRLTDGFLQELSVVVGRLFVRRHSRRAR